MKKHLASAVAVSLLCMNGFAGGELPASSTTQKTTETPEIVQHVRSVTQALKLTTEEACRAVEHEATKYERATDVAMPTRDRYGDPMYARYGARAYAGSPMYAGPAYTASFERYHNVMLPDSEYRGYYRERFSVPGLSARTDVSLAPGATHSYVQSGMLMNPASEAPSVYRPMMNNH